MLKVEIEPGLEMYNVDSLSCKSKVDLVTVCGRLPGHSDSWSLHIVYLCNGVK